MHPYGLADLAGGTAQSLPSVAESSRQDLGCVDDAVAVIANGTSVEFVADGEAVLYPDAGADSGVSISIGDPAKSLFRDHFV